MPKLHSSDHIAKVLIKHGFLIAHRKGSHATFRSTYKPTRIAIVPMGKKEIPLGTFRSMCRQAGLSPEDF